MLEWIKQLTPEFYIVVGFLLVLFIMLIIQIIRLTLVSRRLGTQDFKIMEEILKNNEGELFLEITVSNQAFSTNNLNKIGFKNKEVIHVLSEVNRLIPPRNKHVEFYSMELIESITIADCKKFNKIRIYAENDLGDKKDIKAKVTNKYLKARYKENKKAIKLKAKEERFETGSYSFWERALLILKLFGRPFYKLHLKIKQSTNTALKESEVRRKQKTEHDKVENELNQTAAKARNIKIEEESKRINKTRETELELLKQQKLLEIEKLKREEYVKAFDERKAEIEAINVNVEVQKHFEEHPIDYAEMDEEIQKIIESEKPVEKEKETEKKTDETKDEKIEKPVEVKEKNKAKNPVEAKANKNSGKKNKVKNKKSNNAKKNKK